VGKDELARETELPEGVTMERFFDLLSLGAFLLSLMAPVVALIGGTFFTLVPPRGTLVHAIDLKLVPPHLSDHPCFLSHKSALRH
jgi:hypothetical protein